MLDQKVDSAVIDSKLYDFEILPGIAFKDSELVLVVDSNFETDVEIYSKVMIGSVEFDSVLTKNFEH